MKQKVIETLLAVNNRALQDLHKVCGFDFLAPYGVYQIDGRYTIKQIEKIIAATGSTATKMLLPFVHGTKPTTGTMIFSL